MRRFGGRRGSLSGVGLYQPTDPTAIAWLNAVGFTTTRWNTIRRQMDLFVTRQKAANRWNNIDRIYLGYGTILAAQTCIKTLNVRTLVNLTQSNVTSTGLSYNGSSGYSYTDVSLNAMPSLTETSALFYVSYALGTFQVGTPVGCSDNVDSGFMLQADIGA